LASYEHIYGNLVRQKKALELLEQLLAEEFSLLRQSKTEEVVSLEFSIHELLRQIAAERTEIKAIMQNTRLMEYAGLLPPEQGDALMKLVKGIDDAEQRSSRQASLNTRISLALLDQSQELLNYLQENVAPKSTTTYGARGTYRNHRPQAALISGRM
jgi:FlgN protein.